MKMLVTSQSAEARPVPSTAICRTSICADCSGSRVSAVSVHRSTKGSINSKAFICISRHSATETHGAKWWHPVPVHRTASPSSRGSGNVTVRCRMVERRGRAPGDVRAWTRRGRQPTGFDANPPVGGGCPGATPRCIAAALAIRACRSR